MTDPVPDPHVGIRADIGRLEILLERYDEEISDLEHRLRRLGDGLERAGGRSPALEAERRELLALRRDVTRERAGAARALARLRAR